MNIRIEFSYDPHNNILLKDLLLVLLLVFVTNSCHNNIDSIFSRNTIMFISNIYIYRDI